MKTSWILCCLMCHVMTFDLNDPKTNLESVIRTTSSTNPAVQTVNYINGTIFMRLPGGTLQKLFLVEGFNVARKVPKPYGYLSLSREFLVYRDSRTGRIIDVTMNPVSQQANEVFPIHNDPVNANQTPGRITKFKILNNDRVAFNMDIFLQYPNVLDPKHYPKFTAGPIYQSDELFQFYTRYSTLATTNISDLNYTSTWARRSQFLPWQELGAAPGHLYYTSTNWKCLNAFDDVPNDIMAIVRKKYPEFLHAPDTYEVPNETSWSAFKKIIDERRKEGKPDIIIPTVGIVEGLRNKNHNLDPRLFKSLAALKRFTVSFNGRVYSEITGQTSINLFQIKGEFTCQLTFVPGGTKLTVLMDGDYLDPKSNQVLKVWKNPLTNVTNYVPKIHGQFQKTLVNGDESVWSLRVPNLGETALVGHTSHSYYNNATGSEDWGVDLLDVFFPDEDIEAKNPYLYGTWMKFSSWLEWMGMGSSEGLLGWRMNVELVRSKSQVIPSLNKGTSLTTCNTKFLGVFIFCVMFLIG